MKIEEVVNRAVVIDNIEEEGEVIVDALHKVDVPKVKYQHLSILVN